MNKIPQINVLEITEELDIFWTLEKNNFSLYLVNFNQLYEQSRDNRFGIYIRKV